MSASRGDAVDLESPHEFVWKCRTCGTHIRITGESGVLVSPGRTHEDAETNGDPVSTSNSPQQTVMKCGGFGLMEFVKSTKIHQAAAPAAQPPEWTNFAERVKDHWDQFVRSGYAARYRGVNNRGTAGRQDTPQAVKRILQSSNGSVRIYGATYMISTSNSGDVSLKRNIPESRRPSPEIKSFIYHV